MAARKIIRVGQMGKPLPSVVSGRSITQTHPGPNDTELMLYFTGETLIS